MPRSVPRRVRAVKQRRKKMARRNKAKRQSTSFTGFGGLIARGVRTLLSVLPGSELTTGIADFAFKSLGYSKVTLPLDASTNTVQAEFLATGLTALFHIALKDLLFESFTHGVREDAATWTTNYEAGRLMSLEVSVIPQARMQERQGQWAAVFIPFRTAAENLYYNTKFQGMLYEQVKLIPGAVSAPATKPLKVRFRPTPRDGRLNYDLSLKDEIGLISIGFDQTNRTSYKPFGLDEFSCTVIVSGVVQLQRPHEVSYASKHGRTIDDKLRNTLAVILTPDRKLQFSVNKTSDDHTIEDLPSSVRVRGSVSSDVFEIVTARLAESMAIG